MERIWGGNTLDDVLFTYVQGLNDFNYVTFAFDDVLSRRKNWKECGEIFCY